MPEQYAGTPGAQSKTGSALRRWVIGAACIITVVIGVTLIIYLSHTVVTPLGDRFTIRIVTIETFDSIHRVSVSTDICGAATPIVVQDIECDRSDIYPQFRLLYKDAHVHAYELMLDRHSEYSYMVWKHLPSGEAGAVIPGVDAENDSYLLPLARAEALRDGFIWKTKTFGPILIRQGDREIINLINLYAQGKDRLDQPTINPNTYPITYAKEWAREMQQKYPAAFHLSLR